MGISLSGGDYQYNRFDAYEASLEENRQAAMSAGESEGKSMMSGAGKPAKVTGGKTRVEMGKDGKPLFKEGKDCGCDDEKDKKKKGKKGSSGYVRDDEEEKEEEESPGEVGDGGMSEEYEVTKSDKKGNTQAYKNYKAGMKNKLTGKDLYKAGEGVKEELNNQETGDNVMEHQMARYSRALGMMGKHYSGPQLTEKKADKDYDGDGKVESSKEEYFGSKDKAIKKAMKKEEVDHVDEGFKPLPKEKMERQSNKAYAKEVVAAKAGDEKETNKQMQRGIAMKDPSGRKNQLMNKEEVSITKEMVVEYLVSEGYASNEVSAEILHTHVSDEFLAQIEESMISE